MNTESSSSVGGRDKAVRNGRQKVNCINYHDKKFAFHKLLGTHFLSSFFCISVTNLLFCVCKYACAASNSGFLDKVCELRLKILMTF